MSRSAVQLGVVTLALIGACAWGLSSMRVRQHLGHPGVKVVEKPIYGVRNELIAKQSVYLPEAIPGFSSTASPVSQMEVNWLPPDTLFGRRSYEATNGFSVLVSVVLMGSDRTSIHKPEYCLAGAGWQIEKKEDAVVRMEKPDPYELPVKKFTVSSIGKTGDGQSFLRKGIYVFWFVADGELTASHGERMRWIMRDILTNGVLQRWAYITYFAACRPGEEEQTFQRVTSMIRESVPKFQLTPAPRAGQLTATVRPE